jgi:hypothetical protein
MNPFSWQMVTVSSMGDVRIEGAAFVQDGMGAVALGDES